MLLEDVDVTQTVFDELRANQLSRIVPFVAIGCKDTVAQKVMPIFIEVLALSIVLELCC
jgi:hypothetical protein